MGRFESLWKVTFLQVKATAKEASPARMPARPLHLLSLWVLSEQLSSFSWHSVAAERTGVRSVAAGSLSLLFRSLLPLAVSVS